MCTHSSGGFRLRGTEITGGCVLPMRNNALGFADASRVEPDNDGGDNDHRPVVGSALLIARRQPTPLLEAIDAALHHVATRVDRLLKDQRTTRSDRATRPLISALRYGMRDL